MAPKKRAKPEAASQPADGEAVGRSCPICQTQIVRGESIVCCPGCTLNYHDECWEENEGCGAYGCADAPETVKSKGVDADVVAWEGEKRCPSCAQKIKAQAQVCMHCKAKFWTRDPISREAWAGREYSGDEVTRVRNVLVLVFMLSACGPCFPIMAPATALWIWSGAGPYPYMRLPPTLQILLKASFGASVLWAVVLVIVLALSS